MSIIKNITNAIADNYKKLPGKATSCHGVIFLGGSGNDEVIICGDKNKVNTQDGNDKILVVGNCNIIADSADENNIAVYGDCNDIGLGSGKDTVIVSGDNTSLYKESGSLVLGSVGDNLNVCSTAEDNAIAIWGKNINIQGGDGNWDIRTLDNVLSSSSALKSLYGLDFATDTNLADEMEKRIEKYYTSEYRTESETELVDSETVVSVDIQGEENNPEALIEKYDLSDSQAEVLRSVDLSETLEDGSPRYSLVNVKRYGGSTDLGYFVVENTTSKNGKMQGKVIDTTGLTKGQTDTFTSTLAEETNKITTYITTDTYKTTDTTYEDKTTHYVFDGVENLKINVGNGNLTGHITANDGCVCINKKDADNNTDYDNLKITAGYEIVEESTEIADIQETYSEEISTKTEIENLLGLGIGSKTYSSPLILDMNGDGKVSATSGYGVDINNDGKADGAATNGDKMLAMSDINGSGAIDGNEVFGDQTVSPFTGKKLNAANGFEALKLIAQEAEERGFECIENGKVNLKKLAEALATVNVQLGFISDFNNTELEEIENVKTIDVENYSEADDTGNVQHRQQGSFETEDGKTRKIDDVWFTV